MSHHSVTTTMQLRAAPHQERKRTAARQHTSIAVLIRSRIHQALQREPV